MNGAKIRPNLGTSLVLNRVNQWLKGFAFIFLIFTSISLLNLFPHNVKVTKISNLEFYAFCKMLR